jgi:hypothetical protein
MAKEWCASAGAANRAAASPASPKAFLVMIRSMTSEDVKITRSGTFRNPIFAGFQGSLDI